MRQVGVNYFHCGIVQVFGLVKLVCVACNIVLLDKFVKIFRQTNGGQVGGSFLVRHRCSGRTGEKQRR